MSEDVNTIEETPQPMTVGKQSVYTFTCSKCGTLVHVNSDNSLTTAAKKNLHTCPIK